LDSEVGGDHQAVAGGRHPGSGLEGSDGGASAGCAVGADGVVVGGERLELALEGWPSGGRFLAA
jgi:hypothetical protein